MKKSKLMKALLVFGMSMVTATAIVGFTACDEEHTHVDADNNGKCDVCDTPMKPNEDLTVAVTKVELDESEITLDINGEKTLTATVTPDNADDKTVTWTSSNPSVATVDDNGKVTALAEGETTITATAGGKSAECLVKVNEPAPKPTITKEEWEAALSEDAFTNFTALYYMSAEKSEEEPETPEVQNEEQDGEAAEETKDELKADLANGKYYVNENGSGVYYSKEADDKYYKYAVGETEGQYEKEEITKEDYDGTFAGLYPMYAMLYKDCFGDVEYNEETESYIGTGINIGDGNTYNIEFKFNHGKLVYAEIDYGEDANIILEYSNYGKTAFDLPTIGGDVKPDPDPNPDPDKLPKITEWGTVGDPIYAGENIDGTDYIYHHLFLDDSVAQAYDFDSYEVTAVTLDGKPGEVVAQNPFDGNVGTTHTYHMHVRIKGNKYQTTVFTIKFKKDGEAKAIGTYTREGTKEIVLDSTNETVSLEDSSLTINITSINGSNDFTDKQISWSISDTSIATIPENSNGSSVVVTALKEGKATLTCTVGEGDDAFSETCSITIVEGEVDIKLVDLSKNVVFNNKFTTSKEAIQVRCELNGKKEYDELVKQIDPSKTTVTVTMDGNESTGNIIHKQWQADNVYNMYIQVEVESDWSHDYVFRFSFKNSKGVEVAYSTYSEVAPKTLTLGKPKIDLELEVTETEVLTATKTSKVEGDIEWTVNDEGQSVISITPGEDNLSVTVTALTAGTATITAKVDGLTQTCTVNVYEKGKKPEPPKSDFTLVYEENYGEHYFHFSTTSDLPAGFACDDAIVYKDGEETGTHRWCLFDNGHLRIYVTDATNAFKGDWKFELYNAGVKVATLYYTYNG